jgi:amidase
VRKLADRFGFSLDAEDLRSFQGLIAASLESFARVDAIEQPVQPLRYARRPGYRPSAEENRYNAWYWKCSVPGADAGPLAGKRVVAKDNICVAGIPMMNGSRVLEGYVPEFDATVITRVLEAGGEIVGKAVCEHLSFGGSSFTADTGPVLNPFDLRRTTGGSSSGAAALVAVGECDMAVAADQGGSIRIPAAWCGVYGLKPTYGLVPYTGIFPSELTLDHTGTIARSTRDTAMLLEAVAGPDQLDPRQREVRTDHYTSALDRGIGGLRIGVLREGFSWPGISEPDVDDSVRDSASVLQGLGAEVVEVSVPMHRDGTHIWRVIGAEGRTMTMIAGNGAGTNWKGFYPVSLVEAFARGRKAQPDLLSDAVKLIALLGTYVHEEYGGTYYAKAQNLARSLSAAFDFALSEVDLLLLPTAPMKATLLPEPGASREERIQQGLVMAPNTCPFNITGHPAITVPCAMSEGLPVGMMLVARRWEENTLLRAAHAFEQTGRYQAGEPSELRARAGL